MQHPEVGGPLGDILAQFSDLELVDVWCNGCGEFRKMNSVFAKYLDGEIGLCSHCNPRMQKAKRTLGL